MIVEDVVKILNNDGVIAMRTDTVYGLLARIDSEVAIQKILNIKKRDWTKGLPVLCSDMVMVGSVALINDNIQSELLEIWPTAITVILPAFKHVSKLARGSSDNIAVRIPNDENLIKIIAHIGMPLIATSANRAGEVEIRSFDDLKKSGIANEVDMAIDGGEVSQDIKPSVIIDFTINPHQILRK